MFASAFGIKENEQDLLSETGQNSFVSCMSQDSGAWCIVSNRTTSIPMVLLKSEWDIVSMAQPISISVCWLIFFQYALSPALNNTKQDLPDVDICHQDSSFLYKPTPDWPTRPDQSCCHELLLATKSQNHDLTSRCHWKKDRNFFCELPSDIKSCKMSEDSFMDWQIHI